MPAASSCRKTTAGSHGIARPMPCAKSGRRTWHGITSKRTAWIEDVCVLHTELAGDYLIPPAHVELMYQTELQGHSGTFRLRVEEKAEPAPK